MPFDCEKDFYFGRTEYCNVGFSFGFNGRLLELAPLPGEEDRAKKLDPSFIAEGVFAFTGEGARIQEDCFELVPSNAPGRVVVFPDSEAFRPVTPAPFTFNVGARAFFLIEDGSPVVGLRFHSPHLSKCYIDRLPLSMRVGSDGSEVIATRESVPLRCSFDKHTTVEAIFWHNVVMSCGMGKPPVAVESVLDFRFDAEMDFSRIFDIAMVARDFLAFCLQASGAEFDDIELLTEKCAPDSKQQGEGAAGFIRPHGRLKLCRQESLPFKARYHIPIGLLEGFEDRLFRKLADEELSLRHLPTPENVSIWDEERILFTAGALDQEVDLLYPEGIEHKERTLAVRDAIIGVLKEVAENGKSAQIRREAKRLIGIEKGDSFSARISYVFEKHAGLFRSLSNPRISEETCNEVANRIEKLRNALAHGHLDVRYGDTIVDDALALEQLILGIQMIRLGLSDEDAAKLMNEARARR